MSNLRTKRLSKEFANIIKTPIDECVIVRVDPKDIGIWYFVFRVDGGEFIFKIKHDKNYPFAPPELRALTPNGVIDVGCLICTTFSSYHTESWDSSMTTEKIIMGLISYFHSARDGELHGVGVNVQSKEQRAMFAADSKRFNKETIEMSVRNLFKDI